MERNVKFDLMKGNYSYGDRALCITTCCFKSNFAFHMPLFFIISGYLYKERPIMDIIRRNTKKVLVPYIVTGG